jgi:hypothetical protein
MSNNTGSRITQRPPIGADQLAKWKQALADQAKAKRQRRGRQMRPTSGRIGPGMVRVRSREQDGPDGLTS